MTKPHMPSRIMVWIDHQVAILVMYIGGRLDRAEELYSNVDPHTHGGGWSQHHLEAHRHAVLQHFYDKVIHHLGTVDEILILGPGQAKHELHRQIDRHKGLKGKVVQLRNADKMSKAELIGQAESFFACRSEMRD